MRLIQETYHDRQGEEALTYLYEDGSYVPLARIDHRAPAANDGTKHDTVYYFHNDVSGMPEELTDSGGDLIWQARYKVWGNAVQEEWIQRAPARAVVVWDEVQAAAAAPGHVPRPQNLRFQGQYLDRETGLHYNTFRFYDPDVGRFINQDPIGLRGGVNLYQYAANPVSWIDPWGLTGFFTPSTFTAPSGSSHTVYQQAIDWNLPVNTRSGTVTNLDLAASGKSPFVVKDGVYSQLNLHHSNQDGLGSLYELSSDTHQGYYGSNALHPYLPNAHPVNPVNRDTFNADREAYWKQRAAAEMERRKSAGRCGG
jgi:RHS repeat-associated protein